ncbi:MAG: hypothetical protein Q7R42_00390 [Candidatus Planktophila sp.]|nr:hypothetical protein [Candidatus Planktophila sp.]
MTIDRVTSNKRKLQFLKYVAVAVFFSLLTFSVSLVAFSGSRTVNLALVQPDGTSASPTPTANPISSGEVALTESELISAVKAAGGSVYWIGPSAGAKYTFNRVSEDQNFIRYLPGGTGLADTAENYRIIATYTDPTAYETMKKAAESTTGVSFTNPDGSIVYYLKASPLHVYLAFKNFGYQIEIFDPTPGEALKIATTPGILKTIK